MIIIETERLIIRHFHLLDAEALEGIFCDPEVMRYGQGVHDKEWIQNWLGRCLKRYYTDWGFGLWAVIEKGPVEVIGYCGLSYFPNICGVPEIEIGYRLIRKKWCKGYATEAASAVCQYAFEKLSIKRLIALVDPGNINSLRVVEKLKMKYEKDYMAPDYDHSDRVYVLEKYSNLHE